MRQNQNTYTEKDARLKTCTIRLPGPCGELKCIASECMQWLWAENSAECKHCDAIFRIGFDADLDFCPKCGEVLSAHCEGWCGLVNIPAEVDR